MLDDFWSLQYMIPAGVLNGFAGSLKPVHEVTAQTGNGMTHALHFRFQSMQVGSYVSDVILLAEPCLAAERKQHVAAAH